MRKIVFIAFIYSISAMGFTISEVSSWAENVGMENVKVEKRRVSSGSFEYALYGKRKNFKSVGQLLDKIKTEVGKKDVRYTPIRAKGPANLKITFTHDQ